MVSWIWLEGDRPETSGGERIPDSVVAAVHRECAWIAFAGRVNRSW